MGNYMYTWYTMHIRGYHAIVRSLSTLGTLQNLSLFRCTFPSAIHLLSPQSSPLNSSPFSRHPSTCPLSLHSPVSHPSLLPSPAPPLPSCARRRDFPECSPPRPIPSAFLTSFSLLLPSPLFHLEPRLSPLSLPSPLQFLMMMAAMPLKISQK